MLFPVSRIYMWISHYAYIRLSLYPHSLSHQLYTLGRLLVFIDVDLAPISQGVSKLYLSFYIYTLLNNVRQEQYKFQFKS